VTFDNTNRGALFSNDKREADTSPFDVTDHRAAQAAIDAIIARYGRLDILKTAKAIGLEEAKCGILIRLGIARTIDQ
jgi:NAD(P)-dependent dehydrogenase (short-subunit alcohol dehydrogenase family)